MSEQLGPRMRFVSFATGKYTVIFRGNEGHGIQKDEVQVHASSAKEAVKKAYDEAFNMMYTGVEILKVVDPSGKLVTSGW